MNIMEVRHRRIGLKSTRLGGRCEKRGPKTGVDFLLGNTDTIFFKEGANKQTDKKRIQKQ